MKIYHYHPETGVYLGDGVADESPLEPGVFHIPAHATSTPPLPPYADNLVVFRDGAWGYVHVEMPEEEPVEEPVELTPEQQRARMPILERAQVLLALWHSHRITEKMVDEKLVGDVPGMIEWKNRLRIRRDHYLIDQLAAGFGLHPEQVDALWIEAVDL